MPAQMPAPTPFLTSTQPIPALALFPLNDTFIPKYIHLNQRVKIGRQTNAKTTPGERNGYFDSKVLSRQHAEVWEEEGKIFIKDVKSSNGTFINGERLSAEGVESQAFELKSDDIVEFGIDIVGEDNKTIVHHKVAARVACILTPEHAPVVFPPPMSVANGTQRRPNALVSGPAAAANVNTAGLGSMGAPAGRPKTGLTFEHILSRLQNGIIQSRETGQELGRLSEQMNDIGDTLSGNNPGPIQSYPLSIPSVRPDAVPAPSGQSQPPFPVQGPDKNIIASLQAQLTETQTTLASHVDKLRGLTDLALDYETMKMEFIHLRNYIEEKRHQAADEDDTKSFTTVTPGQEDNDEDEDDKQLQKERQELVNGNRPHTPEPMQQPPEEHHHPQIIDTFKSDVTNRLDTLSEQLETALSISRSLQAQQASTEDVILSLESKIASLESKVEAVAEAQKEEKPDPPVQPKLENGNPNLHAAEPPILDLIKQWSALHSEWGTRFEQWETRIVNVEGGHKNLEESLRTLEGGFRSVEDGLRSLENGMKETRDMRQKAIQEIQVSAQAKRQVPMTSVSTAISVLVLSVVAAVVYRAKE